ncbi:PTS mannitol transporter subunit IICB [Geomicrobium sp. JCM 19055]|uniref:PTS mannitol transporter subunit IICB n=1 Tax=Geomicrobium sp. JCM 19055 TaxID=1460649 RepID=UPI00187C9126
MPNIGAFIAWGILTAIAVPTEIGMLEAFVDPMVFYLLPLLIAFAGGRMIHDFRGGVVGATAAMGVIVAADIPMFIGAMIMGPLGGYVIKKFDQVMDGKVRPGFEMLINNFSAGIIGALLAIIGSLAVGPVVQGFTVALGAGVDAMISIGALPLVSLFIEPARFFS